MAVKTKAVSEREIERVTVDTTMATKAVAHPTDSHLMLRAIEWLNRAADKVGVKLRQSYLRLGRHTRREVARLLHTGGHSQAMRHLRKMRTWVGRLLRDLERKTKGKPAAEPPLPRYGGGARRPAPPPETHRQAEALRASCSRGGVHRQR